MVESGRIKRLLAEQGDVLPLCGAGFVQTCGGGVWFVAMPFILKRLGGTDTQLGLCIGLWFVGYTIGCISAVSVLDKFRAKELRINKLSYFPFSLNCIVPFAMKIVTL